MTSAASYAGSAARIGARIGALPLAALACATSAMAEGRNDPFMRCTFADGRIVVLAEKGDGFEWREGQYVAPLVAETPRLADDPILTFIANAAEPERIDVFLGRFVAGQDVAEIGTALLTRTILDDAGLLTSQQTPGHCEDFTG